MPVPKPTLDYGRPEPKKSLVGPIIRLAILWIIIAVLLFILSFPLHHRGFILF